MLPNVPSFLFGIFLVLLFGYVLSWIFATVGLLVGDPETAQAAAFPVMAPLVFASSAFVPVKSMPGWLQAWAKVNPVSIVVNAIRSLTMGGRTAAIVQGGSTFTHVWQALAWIVGILVVFVPLAVRRYRRTT